MTGYLIVQDAGGAKAALIDDEGLPLTLAHYRSWPFSGSGALFAARVTRVDRVNDQAFLDIGGTDAVLPVRRAKHLADRQKAKNTRHDATKNGATQPHRSGNLSIGDCVQEGQRLLVQGVAEAIPADQKALSVTARPRLVGRYAIVEAGAAGGFLKLNPSKSLKPQRLTSLRNRLSEYNFGGVTIILRSSVEAVDDDMVLEEIKAFVARLSGDITTPGLLWQDPPLYAALRDTPEEATSLFCAPATIPTLKAMITRHMPDMASLDLNKNTGDALEALNEAIDDALAPAIMLPSGGSIRLETTAALTAVDVNMGGALIGRSAADAKRITNMEAALALAYHLRFQNIGGLVVVDFINMTGKGAAKALIEVLDRALADDTVPVQHGGLSQFGLMELSRGRSGLSLRDRLVHHPASVPAPFEQLVDMLTRAEILGNSATPGVLILPVSRAQKKLLEDDPALIDHLKNATKRDVIIEPGTPADPFLSQER